MKKHLNLILIPITIAVLGIMYFQVDWMFKTYNAEVNRINIGTETALIAAVTQFGTEQRAHDSAYIYNHLKRWADTVKMTYINNGDSLHIELENAHPIIQYPTRKTGYYVRFTLSSPYKVSIMSPSTLHKWDRDEVARNGIARNEQMEDSISNFFCLSPIEEKDKFFMQMENVTSNQSLKTDTAKILRYLKDNLKANDIIRADLDLPISSMGKKQVSIPGHEGIISVQWQPNVFHRYIDAQWLTLYYPNQQHWIIKRIAPRVGIAVLLVIIMIFSFWRLIKIIRQQKQLADIKDDFMDNLTHEFKTPIATISAAIEGMQKFNALNDPEKTGRYLDISKNELTRLNDMVTKLLNISVYEKNNLKLTLHDVDVAATINEVINMEQFRAVKPVKFVVDLDQTVKHIQVDPLHFKNVLINLVDNAVKYSKESVEITITGTVDNGAAQFSVTDNGIGIPAAELKNVFGKFYRVPTGDVHNVKGNGLGLSYVKSVIQAHGGTITVNSEINKQTTFNISIPLK